MLKGSCICIIIGSRASKYEKKTCKKSAPVNLTSDNILWILLITEVVPKIFPNFNVVTHLVVPVG